MARARSPRLLGADGAAARRRSPVGAARASRRGRLRRRVRVSVGRRVPVDVALPRHGALVAHGARRARRRTGRAPLARVDAMSAAAARRDRPLPRRTALRRLRRARRARACARRRASARRSVNHTTHRALRALRPGARGRRSARRARARARLRGDALRPRRARAAGDARGAQRARAPARRRLPRRQRDDDLGRASTSAPTRASIPATATALRWLGLALSLPAVTLVCGAVLARRLGGAAPRRDHHRPARCARDRHRLRREPGGHAGRRHARLPRLGGDDRVPDPARPHARARRARARLARRRAARGAGARDGPAPPRRRRRGSSRRARSSPAIAWWSRPARRFRPTARSRCGATEVDESLLTGESLRSRVAAATA